MGEELPFAPDALEAYNDLASASYGESYGRRELDEFRRYAWKRHGVITLDSDDADAACLSEALVARAATTERPFMPDDVFQDQRDETAPYVVIEAQENPMEFPVTAFVSAVGFDSWEGRSYGDKEGRPSREVIADYASRPTEIPPVDEAFAMIQPDGEVILEPINSHRTAAAKLKGQQSLAVKRVTVARAKSPG